MIEQRRTIHHMADRRIALMPLYREPEPFWTAHRTVCLIAGAVVLFVVLYGLGRV